MFEAAFIPNIPGLTTLPNAIIIITSSTIPCIPQQTSIQGHATLLLNPPIVWNQPKKKPKKLSEPFVSNVLIQR